MEKSYKELLSKAYETIPKLEKSSERFEVPKVQGHVEGNKTIVTNFKAICSMLRREPEHLLKYLQRELATPGNIQDARLILNRKISSSYIDRKSTRLNSSHSAKSRMPSSA